MAKSNGHKTLKAYRPQRVNANKHKPVGLGALRNSIGRYGIGDGITVARDGESISGSARLETLAEIMPGVKIVEVETDGNTLIINKRTDIPSANSPRARALSAASNLVNVLDYNPDGEILALVAAEDDVIKRMIADDDLSLRAMQEFAATEPVDAEPQMDKAAELQKKWQTATGQLWAIGEHRLLIGDSTKREDVERVMGGEKAGLVVTSPPYFNQREYAQWETYESYLAFVALVVGETSKHLLDDSIFAVNIGSDEPARRWMPSDWWTIIRDSDASWLYRECIAWVKAAAVWSVPRSMHIENGHYFPAQRWEVILVVSRGKHPKFETSDRDAVREFDENVWQIAVVSGNEQKAIGHNAPFPIEIPRRLIMAYTTKGKIVYEPFLGSGSTIIACEQLGRIGRAIEIAPSYVAVCLERFAQAFPGLPIELLP